MGKVLFFLLSGFPCYLIYKGVYGLFHSSAYWSASEWHVYKLEGINLKISSVGVLISAFIFIYPSMRRFVNGELVAKKNIASKQRIYLNYLLTLLLAFIVFLPFFFWIGNGSLNPW